MENKKKRVHLMVNENFFYNVFEKEKKRYEKKMGVKFKSTNNFTEYLAKCNAKFKIPKTKPMKSIKKFKIRSFML